MQNLSDIEFLNFIHNPNHDKKNHYEFIQSFLQNNDYEHLNILLKKIMQDIDFLNLDEEKIFFFSLLELFIVYRAKNSFILNFIEALKNNCIIFTDDDYDFLCVLNNEHGDAINKNILSENYEKSIQNGLNNMQKKICLDLQYNIFSLCKTYNDLKHSMFKGLKVYAIDKLYNYVYALPFNFVLENTITIHPENFELIKKNIKNYVFKEDLLKYVFMNKIIICPFDSINLKYKSGCIFLFDNVKKCVKYHNRINTLLFIETIKNLNGSISKVFNNLKREIIKFL